MTPTLEDWADYALILGDKYVRICGERARGGIKERGMVLRRTRKSWDSEMIQRPESQRCVDLRRERGEASKLYSGL